MIAVRAAAAMRAHVAARAGSVQPGARKRGKEPRVVAWIGL